MLNIDVHLRSDDRGFLYLECLGKRLLTFRGEQKLILRQLIRQAQEESLSESNP